MALLLLSLALAACAGAVTLEHPSPEPPAGEAPLTGAVLTETQSGETAYRFTLPSGTYGDVSLESYAGKRNVVLVFYRGFW